MGEVPDLRPRASRVRPWNDALNLYRYGRAERARPPVEPASAAPRSARMVALIRVFGALEENGDVRHRQAASEVLREAARAPDTGADIQTALQAHDKHTRGHAERVRVYTDMLTAELGLAEADRERLRRELPDRDRGAVRVASGIRVLLEGVKNAKSTDAKPVIAAMREVAPALGLARSPAPS